MKKLFAFYCLALTGLIATGCGGSSDSQNPVGGVTSPVVNPVVPGVNPGTAGTMPVGCYTNPSVSYTGCAPCPVGYLQQGNVCVMNGQGTYGNCSYGQFYNGYSCQSAVPLACPAGTYWSNYYYACITTSYSMPYYTNYNCKQKSYLGGFLYTWVCY